MDYTKIPQNTFRPIRDDGGQQQVQLSVNQSCSSSQPSPFSPTARRAPKISKSWRQGSDTWSSTGSRQSSRPGSAVQSGSRPSSTHLYCKSGNSSTSDVSVARNFQQLTVSNRRAAFKTQKWSQSFDQTYQNSSPIGPKRRQSSLQHKSLDLDSGYLGSPAGGLVSNQSWTETTLCTGYSQQQDLARDTATECTDIDDARRELAELIQESDSINRSLSLPSFAQSFQPVSQHPESSGFHLLDDEEEGGPAQEELDALDEEIKQIVGDLRSPGSASLVSPVLQPYKQCLKPTPIRSYMQNFSPTHDSTRELCLQTIHGSKDPLLASYGSREQQHASHDLNEPIFVVDEPSNEKIPLLISRDQLLPALGEEVSMEAGGLEDNGSAVMFAVVSTISQKYEHPRYMSSSTVTSKPDCLDEKGEGHHSSVEGMASQLVGNTSVSQGQCREVNRESCLVTPTDTQNSCDLPPDIHQFVFKKTSQFSGKFLQ